MLSTTQILLRLISATVLGGLVGLERESIRRAAGFRTHILVCSGSALVMLLSVFMFDSYRNFTTLDPARLGAQVISGIGFLGAGTIIKDGGGIKGLTTAASLWGVACIGLALGAGFYSGAYITTAILLIALKIFPRVERLIPDKRNVFTLQLDLVNQPGQIGKVADVLGQNLISIVEISLDLDSDDSKLGILTLECKGINPIQHEDLVFILSQVDGVNGVRIV